MYPQVRLTFDIQNNILVTMTSVKDAQTGIALTTGSMTVSILGTNIGATLSYDMTTGLWQGVIPASQTGSLVVNQRVQVQCQYLQSGDPGYQGTWNGFATVTQRGLS